MLHVCQGIQFSVSQAFSSAPFARHQLSLKDQVVLRFDLCQENVVVLRWSKSQGKIVVTFKPIAAGKVMLSISGIMYNV
jgi:hypothetical protein